MSYFPIKYNSLRSLTLAGLVLIVSCREQPKTMEQPEDTAETIEDTTKKFMSEDHRRLYEALTKESPKTKEQPKDTSKDSTEGFMSHLNYDSAFNQ